MFPAPRLGQPTLTTTTSPSPPGGQPRSIKALLTTSRAMQAFAMLTSPFVLVLVSRSLSDSAAASRRHPSNIASLVAHVRQTAPSTFIPAALLRWSARLRQSRSSSCLPDATLRPSPGGLVLQQPLEDVFRRSRPVSSLTFARRRLRRSSRRLYSVGRRVFAGLVAHHVRQTAPSTVIPAALLRWSTRLRRSRRSSYSPDDELRRSLCGLVLQQPLDDASRRSRAVSSFTFARRPVSAGLERFRRASAR